MNRIPITKCTNCQNQAKVQVNSKYVCYKCLQNYVKQRIL